MEYLVEVEEVRWDVREYQEYKSGEKVLPQARWDELDNLAMAKFPEDYKSDAPDIPVLATPTAAEDKLDA
jgi:hypothetical protein